MNRALIILVALCALTTAFAPRDRRATGAKNEICAPQTPCAWSIYKPNVKIIEVNVSNTYCQCQEGTRCEIYKDDTSANAYIHHCTPITRL